MYVVQEMKRHDSLVYMYVELFSSIILIVAAGLGVYSAFNLVHHLKI
jgi:hypothetical protein